MRLNSKRAITFIELLISLVLFGMVILGFFSIDMFAHQQLIAVDRRSKVQNEAIFTLSHISKMLLRAIGDVDPANPAVTITPAGVNTAMIRAKIDSFPDGVRNVTNDFDVAYCFNDGSCHIGAQAHTMFFNANISDAGQPAEIISSRIQSFNAILNGSSLTMQVITCWDPSETSRACGTLDNPSINMTSIIKMPSVSAQ